MRSPASAALVKNERFAFLAGSLRSSCNQFNSSAIEWKTGCAVIPMFPIRAWCEYNLARSLEVNL